MAEKTGVKEPVLDLFGQPWLAPRDPRGRKSHRWSMQVAETVALLKARGEADPDIAIRVGLSPPTLKKYYFRELAQGKDLVRQAVIKAQLEAALKGSSSAAKVVLAELEKGELVETAYRAPGADRSQSAAERPGKKAQRQQAAEEMSVGIFAPGAPPISH